MVINGVDLMVQYLAKFNSEHSSLALGILFKIQNYTAE